MSDFYISNGWKGEKYEKTKKLSTVEVAKLIRREIKKKHPHILVSVRSKYFSMGSSIDVIIKDCDFNPINPAWNPRNIDMGNNPRYTDKARQLIKELEEIGNRYRRVDCDGMIDYFDVNFWYHVSFDYSFELRYIKSLNIAY
jgi:hypothetical protein